MNTTLAGEKVNGQASTGAALRQKHNRRALKFHPLAGWALGKLPFITQDSYWNVPAQGSYKSSNDAGELLACIWMKHLREKAKRAKQYEQHELSYIVRGMINRLLEVGYTGDQCELSEEMLSVLGQIDGFCGMANQWISAATICDETGIDLEDASYLKLLAAANDFLGLNHSNEVAA